MQNDIDNSLLLEDLAQPFTNVVGLQLANKNNITVSYTSWDKGLQLEKSTQCHKESQDTGLPSQTLTRCQRESQDTELPFEH